MLMDTLLITWICIIIKILKTHRGKKVCDIADSIFSDRGIPIGATAFFYKPNNPLENGSNLASR